MKTAVTVINTVQTGIDNYKDQRTTKVFEDSATIFDIKLWAKQTMKMKIEAENVCLGLLEISDVNEY